MTIEVMVDLETMGIAHDSPIVSIGAVKFDPYGTIGELGDSTNPEYAHFHMAVEFHSLTEAGFVFNGKTVEWWLKQSDAARKSILENPVSVAAALSAFYLWFGDDSLPTWGNGAGFDNVILRNAYLRLGGTCPYKFRHDRCYRTINSLFPDLPYYPPVVAHNALNDAMAQAVHLQKMFNRLNFKG
jgi:exodeoxyribonuclease VIII